VKNVFYIDLKIICKFWYVVFICITTIDFTEFFVLHVRIASHVHHIYDLQLAPVLRLWRYLRLNLILCIDILFEIYKYVNFTKKVYVSSDPTIKMKYNNDKFQNTLAYVRAGLCVKNEIIHFFGKQAYFFICAVSNNIQILKKPFDGNK